MALNLQHPLFRVSARSIARRHDTDDVLFVLENYKYPIARVHLTWVAPEFGIAPEFNKEWPSTDLFENWGDWVERGMYPDADVWRLCEVDL